MSNKKHLVAGKQLILTVLIIFAVYLLWKSFSSSIFLRNAERVNVIFYGRDSFFYSFNKEEKNNYLIHFSSSAKMLIPGGYGFYKLGSLNKLVSLEKKPELFGRTFSAATASFVDLYFYPKKVEVFYEDKPLTDNYFPGLIDIFTDQSNAGLIDRFYLFFKFINKNISDYQILSFGSEFDRRKFFKDYQGSFYKKIYRDMADNVQIVYSKSYNTAQLLADMIDGEGIRVVDISREADLALNKTCEVITTKTKIDSPTVNSLKTFFHCGVKVGEVSVSDIILNMNGLENLWRAL